MLSNNSW